MKTFSIDAFPGLRPLFIVVLSLAAVVSNAPAQTNVAVYTYTTLAGFAGFSGTVDGTGTSALFSGPQAVAVDQAGNIYVAEFAAIRKVTPAGVVTTLAGSSTSGTNDGVGASAHFYSPGGIAIDASGNLFVADSGNNAIRKITPDGTVSTFAGVAGRNTTGSADGVASSARFSFPVGIGIDSTGTVYVADANNATIRKISPSGVVSTLAGQAPHSGSSDGSGSSARFNFPEGLAVDASGNLYVADNLNNTIRKISPSGSVTTIAGSSQVSGSADGIGSDASFAGPQGIAVDPFGNLYVGDNFNDLIRKITTNGVVTTIGGAAGQDGAVDGVGTQARFNAPRGVALDSVGNLYVADFGSSILRKGKTSIPIAPKGPFQILSPSFTLNQGISFKLSGPAGATVILDASTDFKIWSPITTQTVVSPPAIVSDPASINLSKRFYRLRAQ